MTDTQMLGYISLNRSFLCTGNIYGNHCCKYLKKVSFSVAEWGLILSDNKTKNILLNITSVC